MPGILLAFSVDIGLLSLANKIRTGQRGRGNLAAFGVLCLAMAFLQFLYIAHHAPAVTLGDGIRPEWIFIVSLIRDASIWVLPGLLPVALILFAFSEEVTEAPVMPAQEQSSVLIEQDTKMPKQLAIEKAWNEANANAYEVAIETPESTGEAIPALPLDRSNGHVPR